MNMENLGTTTTNPQPNMDTEEGRQETINKAIDDFLLEVKTPDPEWIVHSSTKELSVYGKSDEVSGIYKVKIVGRIPHPQEIVLKVLFDHNLRRAWDTLIDDIVLCETSPTGVEVIHIKSKSVAWGVSPRDFVHIRTVRKLGGANNHQCILDVSGTHPKCPETPEYVRAWTYISGGLFEDTHTPNMETKALDQGTLYTMMTQADVKGYIPKMVINLVASKSTADWFTALIKACDDYKKGLLKPVPAKSS